MVTLGASVVVLIIYLDFFTPSRWRAPHDLFLVDTGILIDVDVPAGCIGLGFFMAYVWVDC